MLRRPVFPDFCVRQLKSLEGLIEICNDVIDILGADRQTDRIGEDALFHELRSVQLRVSGACRVDHERFYVRYVREQGEELQIIDELLCLGFTALDAESEDGTRTVREIFIIEPEFRSNVPFAVISEPLRRTLSV